MIQDVRFYDDVEDGKLQFAVILAEFHGSWVYCKHRERNTLEIPGGHREKGEAIEQTARRELFEETGAVRFSLEPVCVYAVVRDDQPEESCGMLFYANIEEFEPDLHYEIEKILFLPQPPDSGWTYPQIQPRLQAEAMQRRKINFS